MRRVKLKLVELEDYRWCPNILRNFVTKSLSYLQRTLGVYDEIFPKIINLIKITNSKQVIDLCSGAFGSYLLDEFESCGLEIPVILSDKYPDEEIINILKKKHPDLKYLKIDAMRVPKNLKGLRTIFTAFHHFPPDVAREVLQDAVDANQPIAVFEMTEFNLKAFFLVFLAPLFNLALTRRLAKEYNYGWKIYFFTWILPAFLIIVLWDGLISALNTYSPIQMKDIVKSLKASNYYWEIQRVPRAMPVTYLIGFPKRYIKNYPKSTCKLCGVKIRSDNDIVCDKCFEFYKKIGSIREIESKH